MRGKIAILIVLIVIAGFGYHSYQLYTAAREIELTRVSIASFDVKSTLLGFIPTKIELTLDLYLRNPTSFSVEIERLFYKVYVNDQFTAEGLKNNIFIPSHSETPVRIPVEIAASDIIKLVWSLITEGKGVIKVDIRGIVDIPLKFFGVIRTITLTIPFEYSTSPSMPSMEPIPTPTPTPLSRLRIMNAYWVVDGQVTYIADVADIVEAHIIIQAKGGPASIITKVSIRKDLRLLPDKEYTSQTFKVTLEHDETRDLSLSFKPDEASGAVLRGYFIEVYINGEKTYTMKSSYPPRLEVH